MIKSYGIILNLILTVIFLIIIFKLKTFHQSLFYLKYYLRHFDVYGLQFIPIEDKQIRKKLLLTKTKNQKRKTT